MTRLLGAYRARLVVILLLSAAGVALTLTGPLLLGRATDAVFAGVLGRRFPAGTTHEQMLAQLRTAHDDTLYAVVSRLDVVAGRGVDFGVVAHHLTAALALYVIAALILLWQGRLVAALAQDVVAGLRDRVEAKLARMPLGHLDGLPRGDLTGRVTNDIETVARGLELAQPLTGLLTVAGALIMMLILSPLLALVLVLTVPAMIVATAWIAGRARGHTTDRMDRTGDLLAHAEEQYTGLRLVRLLGRQDEADVAFTAHNEAMYDASVRAMVLAGTIRPVTGLITSLNYVLTAVFGMLLVASGGISLGGVQAFLQYSAMCGAPVTQLGEIIGQVLAGAASARRVFEVLDAPEQDGDPAEPARPDQVRGEVRFEHVTFGYTPASPVLRDLSVTVREGQTVAIVGHTGAGKTTLVNLLMRFYEPDSGRITLDGVDTAAMSRAELRSRIGMVLQDVWLFGASITDNIAYGAPDATPDEVVAAARAARVHDIVQRLPAGYDTMVGDDDVLSAGEKQLITVARAFLARPALLILDEATSAVDTRTEALIQAALSELRRGRTSFVIAHRLSTIRDADLILVLQDGRVVEQGDHATLVAADGPYARLHADQSTPVLDPR